MATCALARRRYSYHYIGSQSPHPYDRIADMDEGTDERNMPQFTDEYFEDEEETDWMETRIRVHEQSR